MVQRNTVFRGVKNLQIQQIPIPTLLVLSAKGKGIWHLRVYRINQKASIQMVDLVNYAVTPLIWLEIVASDKKVSPGQTTLLPSGTTIDSYIFQKWSTQQQCWAQAVKLDQTKTISIPSNVEPLRWTVTRSRRLRESKCLNSEQVRILGL